MNPSEKDSHTARQMMWAVLFVAFVILVWLQVQPEVITEWGTRP